MMRMQTAHPNPPLPAAAALSQPLAGPPLLMYCLEPARRSAGSGAAVGWSASLRLQQCQRGDHSVPHQPASRSESGGCAARGVPATRRVIGTSSSPNGLEPSHAYQHALCSLVCVAARTKSRPCSCLFAAHTAAVLCLWLRHVRLLLRPVARLIPPGLLSFRCDGRTIIPHQSAAREHSSGCSTQVAHIDGPHHCKHHITSHHITSHHIKSHHPSASKSSAA